VRDDATPTADFPASALGSSGERDLVRAIVDGVADGVLVIDDAGRIQFANPAAGELFGRPVAELVGTEFGFPIVGVKTTEIELVRPGGGLVTAELRITDATWNGEHVALVALRDVTERKRAEDTARQLEHETAARRQAEELSQAKTDFLAVMSHELRTPLNAVLGYTELLDLGVTGPLTDEQRGHLKRVMMSARHLLRLVNEILDFSTLEAGQLTVDLRPHRAVISATKACDVVAPLAERQKLELSYIDSPADEQCYVGDRNRTEQVLISILSNALKFTNAPGKVTLEVVETATAPSPSVAADVPRWLGFRVTDTGIGIPVEQRETVFMPFTQLDTGRTRGRDGTGLGLPLARRLARLMNGDVTIESTASGDGTTVTLWMPAQTLNK
jgi:signal transduction histidine kinase